MLYITEEHSSHKTDFVWRLGEYMPYISPDAKVVQFQADGDELNLLLSALRLASHKVK